MSRDQIPSPRALTMYIASSKMEILSSQSGIAGVDEAGRGPLAGPVVAAAVILDPLRIPEGLRDSKKLSPKRRGKLAAEIHEMAVAVGIGVIHEQDIDRMNILQATFEAMRLALAQIQPPPASVLVDGSHKIPALELSQEALIDGDDRIPAISAASIIAKTHRDAMMLSYDILFPEYGFAAHKGYGSAAHMDALRLQGRCPIHRRTFHPVTSAQNLNYKYFQRENDYGRMGELIAGMFLIRQGYRLWKHSYHAGRNGEIDLIAWHAKTLVFVEVKSFAAWDDQEALERVSPGKQKQIAAIATQFLQYHEEPESEYRFDIITVNFRERKPVIQHYQDAFLPL